MGSAKWPPSESVTVFGPNNIFYSLKLLSNLWAIVPEGIPYQPVTYATVSP